MLIFGKSHRYSEPRTLHGLSCKACGYAPLSVRTRFSYVHLYWIPVLPYQRTISFLCEKCAAEPSEAELLADSERFLMRSYEPAAFPPMLFIGFALLLSVLGVGAYTELERNQVTEARLADPEVGDLYVVSLAQPIKQGKVSYKFRALKLERRDGGVSWFIPSMAAFRNRSDIAEAHAAKELDNPEAFQPTANPISDAELEVMWREGQLKHILRR